MKSINTIFLFFIIFLFFNPIAAGFAEEPEKEWTGTLSDGRTINEKDLEKILADHLRWVEKYGYGGYGLKEADLLSADLHGADLQGAYLRKANLRRAYLPGANLSEANLSEAYIAEADLLGVDLEGVDLEGVDLEKANLSEINFYLANLLEADLTNPIAAGFAEEPEKEWTGTLSDGRTINEKDLEKILADHLRWVEKYGYGGYGLKEADLLSADLHGADLQGAYLPGAYLSGAILSEANLSKADLRGASLKKADLRGADLSEADLRGAHLQRADLSDANLVDANLQGANLSEANFSGSDLGLANLLRADLSEADLRGADLSAADLLEASLIGADLSEANLYETDLAGAVFEIKAQSLPKIEHLSGAFNLSKLKYQTSPQSLIKIRQAFKEAGFRQQEREITYSIKHSELLKMLIQIDTLGNRIIYVGGNLIEAGFRWLFFELTCEWGMSPGRPLCIILLLICLFTFPYTISIRIRKKRDGIWRSWNPERARKDLGSNQPELLRLRSYRALKAGFYFSVLSAFNIGWRRDLNVGTWMTRMQFREYKLQATGWVRFISGLQSLISVYLLALSILTYFGRPFELY